MIHLDTHVALWAHARRPHQISSTAQRLIERGPSQVSPMVVLEMEILHEQGRLRPTQTVCSPTSERVSG
jgi:PIN domain nuclease of toxin-antitoxin system